MPRLPPEENRPHGPGTIVPFMKILVVGAGVIGSIYAAKLAQAGHQVTVLARAGRAREIREGGLVLEDAASGRRSATSVTPIEHLVPSCTYELTMVAVRRDQVEASLSILRGHQALGAVLFLSNLSSLGRAVVEELGPERVLLGLPGYGGVRHGRIIRFAPLRQQPTMVGTIEGQEPGHARSVIAALRQAGIECQASRHMDACLETHAVFLTALAGGLYLAGGDCRRLAEDRRLLGLLSTGMREGLNALQALGVRVAPFALQALFVLLPRFFAVRYWRRFFESDLAEIVVGSPLRQAPDELRMLASDCLLYLEQTGSPAPALRRLFQAIDAYPIRIEKGAERRPAEAWRIASRANGLGGEAA